MPAARLQLDLEELSASLGPRLQFNVPLARFCAARVGGPAQVLAIVRSHDELERVARLLWAQAAPFRVLGGGSNILISDAGVSGVVVLNQARAVQFEYQGDAGRVWAESGANFGLLARQAARRGLSGLEWAAGIPGTLGGAVVGNAGAHGCDMSHNLRMAEILHSSTGREQWPLEQLAYSYRTSILKKASPGEMIVLAAVLELAPGDPDEIQAKMDELVAFRRRTQPPGASMGSMFKNPPGDFAGRLIEAAGLKGARVGEALISERHANFFINRGDARAADIWALIEMARRRVAETFGVELELEIELAGDWTGYGV